MRTPRRPLLLAALAASAAATMVITSACSSDGTVESSETTTGIVDRSSTTLDTTTTTAPRSGGAGEEALVGLWLATPEGITDETGEVWAEPAVGETLRAPLDDGLGGVLYLRCPSNDASCVIEDARQPDQVPVELGEADSLIAVGESNGARVLLTSWRDQAVVPSFEQNTSGLVMRVIDLDSAEVLQVVPSWFGWESGPFAADVANGRWVACFGEGETCEIGSMPTPEAPLEPFAGVEYSTVMSLALDAEGSHVAWVETLPMSGAVNVWSMDLVGGVPSSTELRAESDTPSDDAVTDGVWVAVRVGTEVEVRELESGQEGTIDVASGVTEMAIRSSGSSGGAASAV